MNLHIGLDLGTSGVRAIAIDDEGITQGWSRVDYPPDLPLLPDDPCYEQDPEQWWQATLGALDALFQNIDTQSVRGLSLDGTSGSVLLLDSSNHPVSPALMYRDSRSKTQAKRISDLAPQESAAHGATSSLAKLLWLREQGHQGLPLHQADWVFARLSGQPLRVTDENNALKLGYDPVERRWPAWLAQVLGKDFLPQLPEVHPPGTALANLDNALCERWNLPEHVRLITGTTDSTAAFIATGADQPGQAVTSMGSTLVTKVLAEQPVFAPEFGVYSHRHGELWLVGGASNSGGAVLKQAFCPGEMQTLTEQLNGIEDLSTPLDLDYYPLISPGERFPINDPGLPPRLGPRPDSDLIHFRGILEGIARIEHRAYALLAELGAPYPVHVLTAGGGAHNKAWTRIRHHLLKVPVSAAKQQEAAYGAALLAHSAD